MKLITHQTAMSPQKAKKNVVLTLRQNMEIPKTRQGCMKIGQVFLMYLTFIFPLMLDITTGSLL
jgi:hypothetical protein